MADLPRPDAFAPGTSHCHGHYWGLYGCWCTTPVPPGTCTGIECRDVHSRRRPDGKPAWRRCCLSTVSHLM